ncbi:hypothetical protein MBLNU230_g6181t1 [Neophaeotheca triangularis]
MPSFTSLVAALASASASAVAAAPYERSGAFNQVRGQSETQPYSSNGLTVDLGYEIYEGYNDAGTGLDNWLGIRFAAPPTGRNRWQPPMTPATNRSTPIQATEFGPTCPQSGNAPLNQTQLAENGSFAEPYYSENVEGDEDCLFLNVQAPRNAKNLPVLVWIHGGGYGAGNGRQNLSQIINANEGDFIGVSIQYRLGAFGFMSSDEIYRYGITNAGIYDQHFSLQWIQSYISLFGGDPSRVTISGESAGAGSVMLQDMAYGGTQGDSLFQNSIVASPYLPQQFGYADMVPTQSYFAFAAFAGCFNGMPYNNASASIFECLLEKDTRTLQQASAVISESGRLGTWAFLPVTDGQLIQQLPSQQLLKQQVNGHRMLSGNNANEGPGFTPQDIETENDFTDYISALLPLFDANDVAKLLHYYPSTNATVNEDDPVFATDGTSDPTALNQSSLATGQQQRANNVYAETTFVCPSYWLAEAYALRGKGYASYKYQFSVPPALHADDVVGYFGYFGDSDSEGQPVQPELQMAFMRIWGNFVTHNDPSISNAVAAGNVGGSSNATVDSNPVSDWPQYSDATPYQINLNVTGGMVEASDNGPILLGDGVMNMIELVDAYEWEGGRGKRCDFWRSVGVKVPG